jgi:hypothetical protein
MPVNNPPSAAPTTAQYLALANDSTLSAERVLTPGTNLSATDAGANSTYTLNVALQSLRINGTNGILTVTPATDQNDYNPTNFSSCTFLRVNQSASIKITGMVPTNTDRVVIVQNVSTDYLLILERDSASSTAANRMTWGSRIPLFLTPGDTAQFIYDSTASRWVLIATSKADGFGQFTNFTDFNNSRGDYEQITSGTGSNIAPAVYLSDATEKPYGVLRNSTGTTTTGKAYIGSPNNNSIVPAQGYALFLTRIAVDTLSVLAERYQIFAGYHDAPASTNVVDGVYWLYDEAASANWRIASSAASTASIADASPSLTVDLTYIWLGIFINPGWTRADFFSSTDSVTWVYGGTRSTNMPTATQLVNISVGINKTLGTTSRNLNIDLLTDRYELTRG